MASAQEEKEYLEHILVQVAKKQNIKNFETNLNTAANYGDGFLAKFYTGDVKNKETEEIITVAVKKAPLEIPCNIIFKNEDLFYSLIIPALNDLQQEAGVLKPFNNLPTYFCGSIEPKKEYIAMENLQPSGYVMFDKEKYFDKEHLELIFKAYGKLHALSYVLRKKNYEKYQTVSKELSEIIRPYAQYVEKQMTDVVSAAVRALDTEKNKMIYDELQDLGINVVDIFKKVSKYSGEYKCLVHGDCWSNNMLFKYSESGKLLDVKLIDFQFCQENTPIRDLSYFFYSGAAKEDMDDLDHYLQIYYNIFLEFATNLGATPDELFSFKTFENEWKENAAFGVILGIYLWQVKLIPKKKITDIMDATKEKKLSMDETAKLWQILLESVYSSDIYLERATAILRHAVEYDIINSSNIARSKI